MKKDSRKKSMNETLLDVGVGFVISTVLNYLVLPPFGQGIIRQDIMTMIWLSLIYTIFSIIRRYGMRRLFEGMRK